MNNQPIHRIKNHQREAALFKGRAFKIAVIFAVLMMIIITRLLYLQVFHYKYYTILSQHNQLELLPIAPNRGLIYDRNGILLAENLPAFSLDIIPDYVPDIDNTLKALQTIIYISPENLLQFQKALKQHRRFERIPLKIKLTQKDIASFYVNQYRFPGVVIETQMIRHYPLGDNLASALGYVGRINPEDAKKLDAINYSADNFIGKIGIEKHYEEELHGKTGYKINEVDAAGHIVHTLKTIKPVPGDTLFLTIDSRLQQVANDALGAERGSVVAIDPNNGEVLALVSHPGYDPNLFANGIDTDSYEKLQSSDDKPMFNRAVRGLFPIASTIKPYLALEGLNTGTITAESTINDPGWFKLPNSNYTYRDWVHGGHGTVDVTNAIIESCDTFFYTLAIKLGIERVDEILHQFGFGNKTGIDIDEEISGIVASPLWKTEHLHKHWYLGDTVISGIGQGFMSATPLQLANAVAILAEHGKSFQPHLLLTTKKSAKLPPTITLQNPKYWDVVINAMRRVISDPNGTGRGRFGTGFPYTVAGKTGGAQLFHHKIVNENPTPESENSLPRRLRNHNIFIAFAPIDNPKIAIAVVSENSLIAPTVARKVIDEYLVKNYQSPRQPKGNYPDAENDHNQE